MMSVVCSLFLLTEAGLYSVPLLTLRATHHTMRAAGLLLVLLASLCQEKVVALTLTEVKVPPFGLGGQSVCLECQYDSQGEQVYSVKWYKGGLEIFRFLPGSERPMTVFPRPGVNIMESLSNATVLHLTNLSVSTTGR